MEVVTLEKLIADSINKVKKMKLENIERIKIKIPEKHFETISSDYDYVMDTKISVYSRMINILGSYLKESLRTSTYSTYTLKKSFQIVCKECNKSYKYVNKMWFTLTIKEPIMKIYLKLILEDEKRDYEQLMEILDNLKIDTIKHYPILK